MESNPTANPAPAGYSTICPYLLVDSVEKELIFLREVFEAEVIEEMKEPDGSVVHGEARVGNTTVMMGKSREEYPARQSMNYVFVPDVDRSYAAALQHGGKSLMEPDNKFYGNREAGIEDPQGNQWWIARVVEKRSKEELQQRFDEMNE